MSEKLFGTDWENYPEIKHIVFNGGHEWAVGQSGVTELRAHNKNGMYCNIPYVQVLVEDILIFECCEHIELSGVRSMVHI